MDHLGETHLHQKPNDQQKPPEGCWCNGATNLGQVKWMQQFLALVEETVEKVLNRKLNLPPKSSSLPDQAEPSVSRSLQLRLKGDLPEAILTKNNIEDEGVSLALELCNDIGERVEEISPEFKDLKAKILPLHGDFKVDHRDDWTEEEFEKHVAIPRDDKPPLLKGNSEFSLKNGFARIYGISFTDNSSYMRSRKFRLGAQLVKGLSSGGVVRPAVSEAFQVKEYRLKADQKHPIPLPQDKLWRLVNINKNGIVYQRAVEDEVFTVLDFLQLYYTDARKLQNILQLAGKNWKATVKNAEACNLTNELYKYKYLDDASGDVLLLNCAFNIESVTFKGRREQPYESLDESQKEKVLKLRQAAYGKRKELEKVSFSTKQRLVQAGLKYSSDVEQQEQEEQEQQPPPTLPQRCMDPYVLNVAGFSDLICSNPSTNTYIGATIAGHDNCQQGVMNTSACLSTGADGVQEAFVGVGNNTTIAIEKLTHRVADNGLDLQPVSDFTAATQDFYQQDIMSRSACSSTGINWITFRGQTSQLHESLDDFQKEDCYEQAEKLKRTANKKQSELEKICAPAIQISVQEKVTHPCITVQQEHHHQVHQQQQPAVVVSNPVPENPNADGHEFNQMCSFSPSNILPNDPTTSYQDSSHENCGLHKEFMRQYSMNYDQWIDDWKIIEDCLLDTPLQEERSKVSAHDSATSKLITTCYVTKAAALFMFSVQQDPCSPMKKRKLQ